MAWNYHISHPVCFPLKCLTIKICVLEEIRIQTWNLDYYEDTAGVLSSLEWPLSMPGGELQEESELHELPIKVDNSQQFQMEQWYGTKSSKCLLFPIYVKCYSKKAFSLHLYRFWALEVCWSKVGPQCTKFTGPQTRSMPVKKGNEGWMLALVKQQGNRCLTTK